MGEASPRYPLLDFGNEAILHKGSSLTCWIVGPVFSSRGLALGMDRIENPALPLHKNLIYEK